MLKNSIPVKKLFIILRFVMKGILPVLIILFIACGKKAKPVKLKEHTYKYGRTIFKMVEIPGGSFQMGTSRGKANESPVHKVTLSSFLISTHEITQGQYYALMRKNPSVNRGNKRLPVDNVSWNDCQKFIKRLNKLEGKDVYRLPTEAEWEYACRAGSDTKYCYGDLEGPLAEYAWYSASSGKKTHPVGQLKPNVWGIFDMHGNVWEWCQDWYGRYPSGPAKDPQGPPKGKFKIFRGGSFLVSAIQCRSTHRSGIEPEKHGQTIGFRIVRTEP